MSKTQSLKLFVLRSELSDTRVASYCNVLGLQVGSKQSATVLCASYLNLQSPVSAAAVASSHQRTLHNSLNQSNVYSVGQTVR